MTQSNRYEVNILKCCDKRYAVVNVKTGEIISRHETARQARDARRKLIRS